MDCPFCRQVIEDDSAWCRHCGKPLDAAVGRKGKWYHSLPALVIGFLLLQPFILPAVWSNPRFSRKTKFVITIIVLLLTYLLCVWTWQSLKGYMATFDQLYKQLY